MTSFTILSLFSAIFSVISIILVLKIFRKVYQEDYKKPWLFIGISTIFLMSSQLILFFHDYMNIVILNGTTTEIIIYVLNFISVSFLTYGLLLEHFILRYYKGKFVKMKFIPILEEDSSIDTSINLETSTSYLIEESNKTNVISKVTDFLKQGFEGFLLTEENPKNVRSSFNIQKTPIAWITQLDSMKESTYIKDSLDENADIVDPIQLNNIINYIDNFLEQSGNPLIYLEINRLLKLNNFYILIEFLKYISNKIKKFGGIFIIVVDKSIISDEELHEMQTFLKVITLEDLD